MKIWIAWMAALLTSSILWGSVRDVPDLSIELRLTTSVSSQRSKPGDPVKAVVIVPVVRDDQIVVPDDSVVDGEIEAVRQLNERQHRAGILLRFTQLTFPDGTSLPIDGRVDSVDNARETVDEDGWINGQRPYPVTPSKLEDLLIFIAHAHPLTLAALGGMQLVRREAAHLEVRYNPGVDLTVRAPMPALPKDGRAIDRPVVDKELNDLVRSLPTRTVSYGDLKPGDLTNIVLIGTQREVEQAFSEAGWTTSAGLNFRSGVRTFFAAAEQHPYERAPVSKLLLDNRKPDLVFQKQNDTFAKRHHIRLWQEAISFRGRPVWLGAATHDVGISFSAVGGFRHLVDPSIDNERQKLIDDLVYGRAAAFQGMVDRPDVPKQSRNATGDPLQTDGGIAVLALNALDSEPAGARPR